jgi:signal transduction histidine kinase
MTSIPWSTLVPSVAFLSLSLLALVRGRRDPLAILFAALCSVLFAYNAFELTGLATGDLRWERLAAGIGSLAVAVSVHFRVAFVGMRRRLRVPVRVMYAYFGAIAGGCVGGLVHPTLASFPRSTLYAVLMLAGLVPTLAATVFLLLQHHARASDDERARTQLVLWAILLGSGGGGVDLVAAAIGRPVPRAAPWGFLASSLLLAAVALRLPVFEGVSPVASLNAVAVATVGIFVELALARGLGAQGAFFGLGTAVVTLSVLVAARHLLVAYAKHRARLQYHATLGRLSSQLAHDVRNPLSAIRGAAQYLLVEQATAHKPEGNPRYLELIVQQSDRIAALISRYQRIGRLEPLLASADINHVAESVADAQRAALEPGFELVTRLHPGLPHCRVDRELLAEAIENLIRNAREALGAGGRIEVTTDLKRSLSDSSPGTVVVCVRDEGPGMDARQRELAMEDFFSTKPGGTGLGLPFVRKVAEAFGGRAAIEAEVGKGTAVRIELPGEAVVEGGTRG